MKDFSDTLLVAELLEMVRDTGFEPVTPSVSRKCSTTELTAPNREDGLARYPETIRVISPRQADLRILDA